MTTRTGSGTSVLHALAWFAASYGLAMLGYLGSNAIASRWLGVATYGYFVAAMTSSTVIGQLGLVGVHRGGLREAARTDGERTATLVLLRGGARAAGLVTLPIAALVSAAVVYVTVAGDRSVRGWSALGFAVLVMLGGLQKLWANYLRGLSQVRFASLLEGRSGGALVSCLQTVMLALAWLLVPETGVVGAMVALGVGFALPVGVAQWAASRHWRGLASGDSILTEVKTAVRRNWRFAVNQLATYLASTVEIWIAGVLLVAQDASLFSAAQRLALLVVIPLTSLQVVFAPVVSRLTSQGHHDRLEKVLRTGATLAAVGTSVLWVPMLVAPQWMLSTVYGNPFGAAATALILLTIGNTANVLTGLCGVALTMSHKEGLAAAVVSAAVVARVLLGCLAAWQFGLVGLSACACIITVVTYLVQLMQARRHLGLRTELTLRPDLSVLRNTSG